VPDPRVSHAAQVAYDVLVTNGFKQSESRAVVDAIRDRIEPEMPVEEVVRLAFRECCELPGMRRKFLVGEELAVYLPACASSQLRSAAAVSTGSSSCG
jgi:hypothetical protein